MDIRNVKQIKAFARQRLDNAPAQGKVVLIYAGTVLALSALVTAIQYVLGLQIDQSTGLSGMGMRGFLSALQMTLPFVLSGITMCLGVGYLASMLRVARGQYVSPNSLRLGFDRFWTLLRLNLMESGICLGIAIVCVYAGTMIFLMTPLAADFMSIILEISQEMTVVDPNALMADPRYFQLMDAMQPALWIFLVLFIAIAAPLLFRFRLAEYVVIDKPGHGALFAMRESWKMTRRNCWNLLRLDFSLWWYYVAAALVTIVGYGDQILSILGVELPLSADAVYYGFYALYLLQQLGLCVLLRNRVETCYALAYDSLRPRENPIGGVVLGNIFDMR